MIVRKEGEWYILYNDEMEERARVQLPEHVTAMELERFREYLMKLVEKSHEKPN
jgi:hypothetical protein